jgi:penicillin-binding protein 1C
MPGSVKISEPERPRWRRPLVAAVIAIALAVPLFAVAGFQSAMTRLGPLPDALSEPVSTVVLDRKGLLLRPFANKLGRWRLPVEPGQVDPRYVEMLLNYEDKRFYSHSGIDPLAMLRAAGQLAVNGRIVSGASTLTMQVARLIEPRRNRSLSTKLRQMMRALQLEDRYSKQQILGLYLTLAPFGGNLEGIRAASLAYFNKEPRRLTLDEAALLIALPQSPETRRPDRFAKKVKAARDKVLARAARDGIVSQADLQRAKSPNVPTRRHAFPIYAAHMALREATRAPAQQVHRLTIDKALQSRLEKLAHERITRFGPRHSMAMIVVDNDSGEVLAHVGSPGYLDEAHAGQIDMGLAIRSPGSALKPFIYALAFDAGLAHPETLIEDRPKRFGDYAPTNFDGEYRGTVTLREALQLSLNIPAVQLLNAVGPASFLARLRMAGARIKLPGSAPPDLPLALGGAGISLKDLAMLYASLARQGKPVTLRTRLEGVPDAGSDSKALLTPVSAWYAADILRGTPPPLHTSWGSIAFKTGTSYGYRDAWAAGFDGRHTVAVWVGRPDGGPTPGMTGRLAAAPILSEVFTRLGTHRPKLKQAPRSAIISASAELPPPLRNFGGITSRSRNTPDPVVRIAFPPDGSRVAYEQSIAMKVEGGTLPLTWFVNGVPLKQVARQRTAFWTPDGEGFVQLSIVDGQGLSDSVEFRLENEGRATPARRLLPNRE